MATSGTGWQAIYTGSVHPALWSLLTTTSSSSSSSHVAERKDNLQRAVAAAILTLAHVEDSNDTRVVAERLSVLTRHLFEPFWHAEIMPATSAAAAADSGAVEGARQVEKLMAAMWGEALSFLMLAPAGVATGASRNSAAAAVESSGNEEGGVTDKNELPLGVRSTALAVASAIFGLGVRRRDSDGEEEKEGGGTPSVHSAAAAAAQQLWYGCAFLFLQQLSARNMQDLSPWKVFAASCAAELAERFPDYEAQRRNAGGELLLREADALAAWASDSGVLSPELLKETVERTRFRRAALLFKSFTPHMVSQAPGTTFLLIHTLDSFSTAWRATLEAEVLSSQSRRLNRVAQQFFSAQYREGDTPAEELYARETAPVGFTAEEAKLFDLITAYSTRLGTLLGESCAHGFLLATVVGAVVCTRYIIPHSTRAPAAPPPTATTAARHGNDAMGASGGKVSATATTAPAPTRVVGRGLTGRAIGGALPTAATVTASATAAAAAVEATPAALSLPSRVGPDAVGNAKALASFEADFSWLPRWSSVPISSNHPTKTAVAAATAASTTTESEVDWRLLHFAPFGLLLKRLAIDAFLQPHLFHFCTQLKLGLGAAQHAEARERFALVCLLCGLSDPAVASTMYHYASKPELTVTQTDLTGEAISTGSTEKESGDGTAALAAWTSAMNRFAAAADSEIVFDLSVAQGQHNNSSGGIGLLDAKYGEDSGHRRGRRDRQASRTAQSPAESKKEGGVAMPRNGELRGTRFCVMVNPEVQPLWESFLSAAPHAGGTTAAADVSRLMVPTATTMGQEPQSASPFLLSPCRFIMELLSAHYFSLAAHVTEYFLRERSANVFLVPRDAMASAYACTTATAAVSTTRAPASRTASETASLSIPAFVVAAAMERLSCLASYHHHHHQEEEGPRQRYAWLAGLLPMLRLMGSYAGSQDFLVSLTQALSRLCHDALQRVEAASSSSAGAAGSASARTAAAASFANKCLTLAELYLIYVVMPCLRVLDPSPILYDHVHVLFTAFERGHDNAAVGYGVNEAEYLHYAAWVRYLLPNSPIAQPGRVVMPHHAEEDSENDDESGAAHRRRRMSSAFDLTDETVQRLLMASSFQGPALPPFPQDVLQCKALESLFNQSLKRINEHNVDYYRALLKQVLYAEPIFVVEKLLSQAIGYENSFLAIHTRLLQGLPPPILSLILHHGLLMLRRSASEEKITDGGASMNRVSIVATFMATLWRQNRAAFGQLDTGDGSNNSKDRSDGRGGGSGGQMLLRSVEATLRSNARQDMVLGLELLKALLLQLCHRKLEHEEQFSSAQQKALVTPTTAARLFGRGAMESFRMTRWTRWLTPFDIAESSAALVSILLSPCCSIPMDDGEPIGGASKNNEEAESPHAAVSVAHLNIGQCILLHLCRLQARVYELQADLDGPMDLVLLTSAKDFNSLNDLIFVMEELLPSGPPEAMLARVAMTHVALALSGKFRLKDRQQRKNSSSNNNNSHSDGANGGGNGDGSSRVAAAIPSPPLPCGSEEATVDDDKPWAWLSTALHGTLSLSLLRQLSRFSAAHFGFDEEAYEAALAEWRSCVAKADPHRHIVNNNSNSGGGGGGLSVKAVAGTVTAAATTAAHMSAGEKRPREEEGGKMEKTQEDEEAEEEKRAEAADKARQERRRILASTDVRTALWLRAQRQVMEKERMAHRDTVVQSESMRDALFQSLMDEVLLPVAATAAATPHFTAEEILTAFAMDYLLPRALLSLSDTIFVERLLTWLQRKTNPHRPREEAEKARRAHAHRRVTDLMLTLITGGVALFTGLSDGECKRLGHLLAHLLRNLASAAAMPPVPPAVAAAVAAIQQASREEAARAAAAAAANGVASAGEGLGSSASSLVATAAASGGGVLCDEKQFAASLKPTSHTLLPLLLEHKARDAQAGGGGGATHREAEDKGHQPAPTPAAAAAATAASSSASVVSPPASAYPLQLEAFLCRFFVQYLGNRADIPPHLHRNCLLVLERLDKVIFPSTLCATELLLRVVAMHAEKENRNYASALAALKSMRESYRAKRALLGPLNEIMASLAAPAAPSATHTPQSTAVPSASSSASLAAEAKAWYSLWRSRELYMERQLLKEELALHVARQAVDPLEDEEEEEEAGEEGEEDQVSAAEDGTKREQSRDEDENGSASSLSGEEGSDEGSLSLSESDDNNNGSHGGSEEGEAD